MTTIKSNLPATVEFKAQGIESTVDVSTGHADAIAAVFTYGLRRWVQDHINALAKAHRDDGGDVTESWTNDAIAARLAQFASGDITSRRPAKAVDSFDEYRMAVVLAMFRKAPESDAATAYAAIPSDDQKARREFRLSIAEKNAAIVDPIARREMERDQALADEMGDAELTA